MFTEQPIVMEDDCPPLLNSHLLDETKTLLVSPTYTGYDSEVYYLIGLPYERQYEGNYEGDHTFWDNSFVIVDSEETFRPEYPRACTFSHGLPSMD